LRVLHGRAQIPVVLMIFDLLRVEDKDAICLPHRERRALLERLDLHGPAWRTPEAFEDGAALFEATGRLAGGCRLRHPRPSDLHASGCLRLCVVFDGPRAGEASGDAG
jgi:hypothetical protein